MQDTWHGKSYTDNDQDVVFMLLFDNEKIVRSKNIFRNENSLYKTFYADWSII